MPLEIVIDVIVELFRVVGITDVAEALIADGVVVAAEGGDGGAIPCGGGILEQRDEADAFETLLRGKAVQFDERGVDVDQVDGAIATGVGLGDAAGFARAYSGAGGRAFAAGRPVYA